ncbi:unnamed protein product [Schistosoma margrebowiei]|uniref:Uncharacterized protein n=1 Tax=Schistosoma margrebowiei TaxID=48269 RepID=A0A183N5S1_9TREM|nr:unnamed protein product [Schistosoma margrebowiei]
MESGGNSSIVTSQSMKPRNANSRPPRSIDFLKAVVNAQFENLYDQLSTLTPSSLENQSWFKAKLVDFHSSEPKQRSILTSQHFKSLKELRNNAEIIMLKPDKGSGVVIMNKPDYKNKMESILSDKSKFLTDVDFDGLRKLEKKVNSNLVKLLNMNVINKDEFNLLKPMGSAYPNLYGLPKIHKPNTPLRPILSMCRSLAHNLAKWLTKLLNPIRNQYYNVKFTFQSEHFRQIDGVAMGSPLGPFLADVFMGYVENLVGDSIRKMGLYKRYIDDIIIIAELTNSGEIFRVSVDEVTDGRNGAVNLRSNSFIQSISLKNLCLLISSKSFSLPSRLILSF